MSLRDAGHKVASERGKEQGGNGSARLVQRQARGQEPAARAQLLEGLTRLWLSRLWLSQRQHGCRKATGCRKARKAENKPRGMEMEAVARLPGGCCRRGTTPRGASNRTGLALKTKLIVLRRCFHLGNVFNSLLTEAIFCLLLAWEPLSKQLDGCEGRCLDRTNPASSSSSSAR